MYLPPQFQSTNPAHVMAIMRKYPLASMISTSDEGVPFVSHIPLHLVAESEDVTQWKLLGHVAKVNPHWQILEKRPLALITFMGPQAYLSPQVYSDLARVPTWSYIAVHAVTTAQFLEGDEAKDSLLKQLIKDHEASYAKQWRELNSEFQHKMLDSIIAFELLIQSVECKIKLNQHRPESHTALHAIYAKGNEQEQELAQWMRTLGMVDVTG